MTPMWDIHVGAASRRYILSFETSSSKVFIVCRYIYLNRILCENVYTIECFFFLNYHSNINPIPPPSPHPQSSYVYVDCYGWFSHFLSSSFSVTFFCISYVIIDLIWYLVLTFMILFCGHFTGHCDLFFESSYFKHIQVVVLGCLLSCSVEKLKMEKPYL